MYRKMMQPKCKGQTLEFNLSKWGYDDYIAECSYYYNRHKDKYSLSMWINRKDVEDRMRISSKKVDTQYIPGTRETIIDNICRIVHQMCIGKYFDDYVERYEYELSCFDKGNEIFELEQFEKEVCSVEEDVLDCNKTMYHCLGCGGCVEENYVYCPHCRSTLDWNNIHQTSHEELK